MSTTIVEELLEEMERHVSLLEELRKISIDEFVSDPRHYLFAERCFQLAIQSVVDIAYYLASQKRWPKPETAGEAILLLGRQGVLTTGFATKIVGMANFRNILVHSYLRIDRARVYRLLDGLDDFREFARQTLAYLEQE